MTITLTWTPPTGGAFPIAPPSVWLRPGREGFSTVATRRHSVQTPYGHGAIPIQTLYEPREIMIPISLYAPSRADLDTLIRTFIHAFAPGRGQGTLRYVREDGMVVTIRAEASEVPFVDTRADGRGKSGLWVNAEVVLVADDPFWYSDEQEETLGSFAGGFELPFSFPFELGTSGPSCTLTNDGDLEVPTVIEILGPCSNPTITNHTTGAWFGVDLDLAATELLVISSVRLSKQVTRVHQISGLRTNELNALRTGSSWLEVVPGPNLFGVSTDAAGEPIHATVRWFSRYAGV